MTRGLNKAILIGDVADPPRLKTLGGQPHLAIRLHTVESYRDTHDLPRESHAWHSVVVWGRRAEALAPLVTRGRRIAVEGRIVNRSWEDAEKKKHYVTEINASEVLLLDSREGEVTVVRDRPDRGADRGEPGAASRDAA